MKERYNIGEIVKLLKEIYGFKKFDYFRIRNITHLGSITQKYILEELYTNELLYLNIPDYRKMNTFTKISIIEKRKLKINNILNKKNETIYR